MKALVICHDYPPLNTIAAQRPLSWYTHFREFGVYPIVVAKHFNSNYENENTTQPLLKNRMSDENADDKGIVIRVRCDTSISENLIRKFGKNRFAFIRRGITFLTRIFSFLTLYADHNRNLFYRADKAIARYKPDVIICTGEPFILFKYGKQLSRKHNIPWIADYRDGWSLNYTSRFSTGLFERILRRFEKIMELRIVPTASMVTTVDRNLAQSISDLLKGKKVEVVHNGFDGFFESDVTTQRDLPLTITHTGTLATGHRYEFLLDAVREMVQETLIKHGDLKVTFTGLAFWPDKVKEITDKYHDILPFINFTPRLSRIEALQINKSSDYCAVFTEPEFSFYLAKTFDYLAVRRPILVLPTDNGLLQELMTELNAGFSFQTKGQLKQFLLNAIGAKRLGHNITSPVLNLDKTSFFLRKNQASIFAVLIKAKFSPTKTV